jgi:hypothetical protein
VASSCGKYKPPLLLPIPILCSGPVGFVDAARWRETTDGSCEMAGKASGP